MGHSANGGSTSLEGDDTGTADFENFEITHQVNEIVDLAAVTDHLIHDGVLGVVHDLAFVGIGSGSDVATGIGIVADFDQQKLPVDDVVRAEVGNRDNIGQLVELIEQLFLLDFVTLGLDGDAGKVFGFGFTHGQGSDVELSAAEHAGNTVQHAELVINKNSNGEFHGINLRSLQ